MNYQHLIDTATALGCGVTEHAPLSAATTFKVGGPADLLIDLPDAAAVSAVLAVCHTEEIPYLFIGNGSNLVVGDKGFRGAVLRLDRHAQPTLVDDVTISAPAGMSLQRLCLFARDHSLTGLEFAYGIPGTVGGAVYMNAGAYDGEMVNVTLSADCIAPDGTACTLSAAELNMTYRHTALMERDLIVVGATLRLHRCARTELTEIPKSPHIACLDLAKITFPLFVRTPQEGDRFAPFGMKGTQIISDYLTNRKRNRLEKLASLLLCDAQGPLWLINERPDRRAMITSSTQEVLIVECKVFPSSFDIIPE